MKIGIFIFRRDLRLEDNLGLIKLQNHVDIVIPIFILDIKQIKKNKTNVYYFSNNAVQFMCESLNNLNENLKKHNSRLRLYYGNPYKIINKLIKWILNKYNDIYLGYNKDYSKYSVNRDNKINILCTKNNITLIIEENDYTLIPLKNIIKIDNTGFKQFGAFYKNATKYTVPKPITKIIYKFLNKNIETKSEFNIDNLKKFYKYNKFLSQNGGRTMALNKLDSIKNYINYNDLRDRLDYNTTHLSAYLNFGCISVREAYFKINKSLGSTSQILKQLYWRDFFLQALIYLKNGNEYKHMDDRYNNINWTNNKHYWEQLINSNTGFLLIDAAMNELKISGFMHNRARMLVGVFWTKYLHIDIFHRKYGSQVGFSKYLVDAIGPSQNKFNHQWITEFDYPGKKYAPSTSKIAGRPMDISNKMIKKFDPECKYIKKWLPHLKNIDNKILINWNKTIFDAKEKYNEWIEMCKN